MYYNYIENAFKEEKVWLGVFTEKAHIWKVSLGQEKFTFKSFRNSLPFPVAITISSTWELSKWRLDCVLVIPGTQLQIL